MLPISVENIKKWRYFKTFAQCQKEEFNEPTLGKELDPRVDFETEHFFKHEYLPVISLDILFRKK